MRERYAKVMNFNEEVMACEFEKAERMLKRAEKLIKKAKMQALSSIPGSIRFQEPSENTTNQNRIQS